jgi:hypothetical protein
VHEVAHLLAILVHTRRLPRSRAERKIAATPA